MEKRRIKKKINPGQIVILVFIVFAVLFAIIPIFWVMLCSFQPDSALYTYPPKWIPDSMYLENYEVVLTRTKIPNDILNSARVCIVAVVLALFCSSLFAYALSRSRYKNKNLITLLVLIAQMVPPIILILPLYLLVHNMGLLNTHIALMMIYATHIMPLSIIMLTSFYDTLPRSLDESAIIDGCNKFQVFLILVRLTAPGLAAVAVLGFVITWNDFIVVLTLINESAKKTYQLGLFDMLTNITSTQMKYGYFNAAAMLGLVPLLIAYMFSHKYFIAGLTEGSVKQ